ncbi:MAG: MoxR family ATPase [Defluviicoccus sp.]
MADRRFTGTGSKRYVTTEDVAEIVNLAIRLGRPILVEGEAGCGKTMLASAIAEELVLGEAIAMTVKSTSQAKDLLYRFDALRRLQEIQGANAERARFIYPYITLQPLGQAIFGGKPCVVLIDEIDKADPDFPNDLLEVLSGDFAFDIDDLPADEAERALKENGFGRRVKLPRSGTPPVVVITSNREKQLPEPFLRRCLYLDLTFPTDPTVLARVVALNLGASVGVISNELVGAAIERFLAVRGRAEGLHKPPATSELVDWVKVLHWQGKTAEEVGKSGDRPPYWRLLFKTMQDLDAYSKRTGPMADDRTR